MMSGVTLPRYIRSFAVGERMTTVMKRIGALVAMLGLVTHTIAAHAFCGFYVAGSNEKLFNDATQVVLMRDGTRTVKDLIYRGKVTPLIILGCGYVGTRIAR